jgi:hypothetical protein
MLLSADRILAGCWESSPAEDDRYLVYLVILLNETIQVNQTNQINKINQIN